MSEEERAMWVTALSGLIATRYRRGRESYVAAQELEEVIRLVRMLATTPERLKYDRDHPMPPSGE